MAISYANTLPTDHSQTLPSFREVCILSCVYCFFFFPEGIEILTGLKAGELNEEGEYEEGTVNYLVQEKLYYYHNLSKEFEEE